jgi:hypothetical protein
MIVSQYGVYQLVVVVVVVVAETRFLGCVAVG